MSKQCKWNVNVVLLRHSGVCIIMLLNGGARHCSYGIIAVLKESMFITTFPIQRKVSQEKILKFKWNRTTAEFLHNEKGCNESKFPTCSYLSKRGKPFTNGKLIKSCLIGKAK